MKSLFVWVPDDLYSKFKIQLIKDNTTIKEATLVWMELYVGEGKNDHNSRSRKDEKDNPG